MTDLFLILQGAATVIGGASVIASAFPRAEKVGSVLGAVGKVINFLAFNFGNAKNAK
jgi:hypothetical protein